MNTRTEHPLLNAVADIVALAQAPLILVGGAVRDYLLNQTLSHDLDFVVLDGTAEQVARRVADQLEGAFVPLDPDFGIYRVVTDKQLDFANVQGNLSEDLGRRDLTLNALGLDCQTGELLDLFDGQADLKAKRIRMISTENMLDDPLRLLRVFRFAAQLNGQIDPKTLVVVQEHGSAILRTAPERIQYELLRLLSMPNAFAVVKAMSDCGFLEVLLPELKPMRDIEPNGHHHLILLDHTLELINQAEQLVLELDAEWQAYFNEALTPAVNRMGIIKLACLLHDIGKPDTKADKPTETGIRYTYYGHDQVSETMTAEICGRLKMSGSLTDRGKHLVRWHLYPCQFGENSPRKSVLRFYRRMGDLTPDVLLLALADRFSTLGEGITPEILAQSKRNHWWLLEQFRVEQSVLKQPRILDGKAVMDLLKLKPGKQIGDILEALLEAQQTGEVVLEEDAKAWLLKQYRG